MKLSKKDPGVASAVTATQRPAALTRWSVASLCACAMLASCATATRPTSTAAVDDDATQSKREALLGARENWEFRGRMALSSSGNGGSANVHWRQKASDFDIELSAPITRQTWRLSRHDGQATLEGMPGGPRTGSDAAQLLQAATGWQIPLQSMTAWVRGLRAPGSAELTLGPDGLPATVAQDGWAVQYRGWNGAQPALPLKVFARKGEASVRLVIEEWVEP